MALEDLLQAKRGPFGDVPIGRDGAAVVHGTVSADIVVPASEPLVLTHEGAGRMAAEQDAGMVGFRSALAAHGLDLDGWEDRRRLFESELADTRNHGSPALDAFDLGYLARLDEHLGEELGPRDYAALVVGLETGTVAEAACKLGIPVVGIRLVMRALLRRVTTRDAMRSELGRALVAARHALPSSMGVACLA